MESRLKLDILPQPDETTCGPTCLHALYRYYDENVSLEQVIADTRRLEEGGTFAVWLGCDALRRGFRATIYTYNLNIFDPTWFGAAAPDLAARLQAQKVWKKSRKLHLATDAYLEFLALGGEIRFEDLTAALIRRYLNRAIPVLTGLSATYLYRSAREYGPTDDFDDVRGVPTGHFVLVCGYDKNERQVLVADPLLPNPLADNSQYYLVSIDRLVCAILLGIVTYDANLLIIRPRVTADR